jgi:hypothetical protein
MDAVNVDGLVRSDPSRSGIRRRRCGRGFRYLDDACAVTDTETLARIKAKDLGKDRDMGELATRGSAENAVLKLLEEHAP